MDVEKEDRGEVGVREEGGEEKVGGFAVSPPKGSRRKAMKLYVNMYSMLYLVSQSAFLPPSAYIALKSLMSDIWAF